MHFLITTVPDISRVYKSKIIRENSAQDELCETEVIFFKMCCLTVFIFRNFKVFFFDFPPLPVIFSIV